MMLSTFFVHSLDVLIRNRWQVAYTLVRNPSIQKYTASNIALVIKEKELQEERLFLLEHTIQSVGADIEKQELKKQESIQGGQIDKRAIREVIGMEIRPEDITAVSGGKEEMTSSSPPPSYYQHRDEVEARSGRKDRFTERRREWGEAKV